MALSRRPSRQRGQALVFGLFMLIAGLAALFFFFNVGQLSREKTKLVNTADAVAYSAGVVHARALNFNAYSNRALIANEVLIAQAVSMYSWAKYMGSFAENVDSIHPECLAFSESVEAANPYAAAISAALGLRKFGPEYLVSCAFVSLFNEWDIVEPAANAIQFAASGAVLAVEVQKAIIKAAQATLNATLVVDRRNVMDAVAKANYVGDGSVNVDLFPLTLPDDWTGRGTPPFVRHYKDDERTRFKEATVAAANSDPFIRDRRWTSRAVLPAPECLPFLKFNEVRRRGGTEMLGFDEWRAIDTQSYHYWRWKRFVGCRSNETETAWGDGDAYSEQADADSAPFGGSRADNPSAHSSALSSISAGDMGYTGLPGYYDLNKTWLEDKPNEEPKLVHGVRLTRSKSNLRTTDGSTGQVHTRADSRIGAYDSAVAGGDMAAVSASEVFFERPPDQADNVFGLKTGRPRELGSLFNPYWQVRLTSVEAKGEWLRQGVH